MRVFKDQNLPLLYDLLYELLLLLYELLLLPYESSFLLDLLSVFELKRTAFFMLS